MSQIKPNGTWGTDSKQTSASGAVFVTLPAHDCDEVQIVNGTGTALDLRSSSDSAGSGIKIPDGGNPTIKVSGNSAEIQIRRTDNSNSQVTVGFTYRRGQS